MFLYCSCKVRTSLVLLGLGLLVASCAFDTKGLSSASDSHLNLLDVRPDTGAGFLEAGQLDHGQDTAPADRGAEGPVVLDGPTPVQDGPPCPGKCKTCVNGVCIMDCANGCTCPPNMPCSVTCTHQSCTGKIDCSKATDCQVTCGSDSSCQNDIVCGTGKCTVNCGNLSCKGAIDCSASTICNVTCNSTSSCHGDITCGSGWCTVICWHLSCQGKVDCSKSTKCDITCNSDDSCQGDLLCGSKYCDVVCGHKSCWGTVDCSKSCGCSVSCSAAACGGVTCPPACGSWNCGPSDFCDNCH